MRVLILGASGMLGHKLAQACVERFETLGTVSGDPGHLESFGVLPPDCVLGEVDARRFERVAMAVERVRPDVVINCVGIVKQHPDSSDAVSAIAVNSLFPHRLANLCQEQGIRAVHLSTDCVFSGGKGRYTEDDIPDPIDLYGRSKLLGEIDSGRCLTLRTSMIGRELGSRRGLVEWFLSQQKAIVPGYKRAVFSGLTTSALSTIIVKIIEGHGSLHGVWHVASDPISKCELLTMIRDALNLRTTIDAQMTPVLDRSLDGSRFQAATGIVAPTWSAMISEMATDQSFYEQLGKPHARK